MFIPNMSIPNMFIPNIFIELPGFERYKENGRRKSPEAIRPARSFKATKVGAALLLISVETEYA